MLRRVVLALVLLPVVYLGLCTLALAVYRFIDPPTTGVQLQRRVEAWLDGTPY
ncbi:MAG: monofunctional biosynthetic peptidoglycan transglycosylase, partial [Bacteroidetes bacterium]